MWDRQASPFHKRHYPSANWFTTLLEEKLLSFSLQLHDFNWVSPWIRQYFHPCCLINVLSEAIRIWHSFLLHFSNSAYVCVVFADTSVYTFCLVFVFACFLDLSPETMLSHWRDFSFGGTKKKNLKKCSLIFVLVSIQGRRLMVGDTHKCCCKLQSTTVEHRVQQIECHLIYSINQYFYFIALFKKTTKHFWIY